MSFGDRFWRPGMTGVMRRSGAWGEGQGSPRGLGKKNSYFFIRFFEFFVGKPEALAPTGCLRGFGGSELEPVCLGF